MKKFKVGDKVQVAQPGNTYETYKAMFERLGFNNTVVNEAFQKGLIAEVFAVGEHDTAGIPLLGLQAANGTQSLVSTKGVVKVVTTLTSEDKFDIIREFCDDILSSEEIEDKVIYKYLLNKSC